jgi:hypothetical protein
VIVALFDAITPFNVTYESETIAKEIRDSLADMHARGSIKATDTFYLFDAIL